MTKKDYIRFASIIKDSKCNNYNNRLLKDSLIDDLCIVFKQDNDRFDSVKFINACE